MERRKEEAWKEEHLSSGEGAPYPQAALFFFPSLSPSLSSLPSHKTPTFPQRGLPFPPQGEEASPLSALEKGEAGWASGRPACPGYLLPLSLLPPSSSSLSPLLTLET